MDSVIERAGQEFTGSCGVVAGYNIRLNFCHNTVVDLPYGGISVGAGAAHAGCVVVGTLFERSHFGSRLIDR